VGPPPPPAAYAQAPAGRGRGGAPRPADVAAPRTDRNSQLAHEQLLEKARAGGVDVYFVGDSIARRWGATDYPQYLANWRENFFGWNAGDFAWGADRIENILWRLENGELDGVSPKVFVVHGGTNNLTPRAADPAGAAEITRGLAAVLYLCRQKAPSATIILTGIFPRNDNMALLPAVAQVNESLARLADGKTVRFLNINDTLADANGVLHEGMMRSDKLHPDLKGYQVWADALKPLLTEILGPPAATDHAPPPTGDPSAAGRAAGAAGPAPAPRP
jgi:lysophospholipase L1-like esterase